jgi:hypothetical protein
MSESLIKKLDLNLAVRHIINDSKTDFIIDKLGIELLENYSTTFVKHLEDKILSCESVFKSGKEYEPHPLQLIDVPKKDLSLRPGAVPEIIDRIYYQSLCNAIAPNIDNKLKFGGSDVVFSYRLAEGDYYKDHMFVDQSTAHNEFIGHQSLLCDNSDFKYVIETDISNYFERIYHHNLISLLESFHCDDEIVTALAKLLRKWTEGVSYGLPQGLWASDLLGNIYLYDLDIAMKSENYHYIRYVDDIRLFCNSKTEAKTALIKINQTLRTLGLNIQPSKTYIHEINDFCQQIHMFHKNILNLKQKNKTLEVNFNSYFNEFESIKPDINEETFEIIGLDDLFDSATQNNIKEQELRFCLNAYSYIRKPKAVSFCIQNLEKLPYLSSYFINYLTSLDYDEDSAAQILAFLKSEDNLYVWQEMWLLRYFYLVPEYDYNLVVYLRKIFLDNNKPVATRSIAALILGKIGESSELRFLRDEYRKTDSSWIKRAIIVGITRLPEAERNHSYSYWKRANWCFEKTIDYAKNHNDLIFAN